MAAVESSFIWDTSYRTMYECDRNSFYLEDDEQFLVEQNYNGSFYETQIPKHQLSLEDAFVVDSATIELGPTLAALNEVNETFSEVEINEPWLDAIELAIRNDYAISQDVDMKWEEIKQFISLDEQRMAASTSRSKMRAQREIMKLSISTEDYDSDSDASETESLSSDTENTSKRYFWQYNLQSKGPKGKRLCRTMGIEDPHILNDFQDPVHIDYSAESTLVLRHSGKIRRGDGNDVTPNPEKLFRIGRELDRLNSAITRLNDTQNDQVTRAMRREKNKYASRACRLKKKAQHEANKLKLAGLELEHSQLMRVITSIKSEVITHLNKDNRNKGKLTETLDSLSNIYLTGNMVAGHTTEYVNSILEKLPH